VITAHYWTLASSISKLLMLLATAGVVGGSFCLGLATKMQFPHQPVLLRYLLASAGLGLLATPLFFLVQVGAINQEGVAGMLDFPMALILAQSNLGHAAGLRMAGFLCVVPAFYLLRKQHETVQCLQRYHVGGFTMLAVATALLCLSFAMTGHISTLSMMARSGIVAHALGICLWIGALYPLLYMSIVSDVAKLQKLLRCFGAIALPIVVMLIASGVFLLTRLLHSPSDFLSTPYGISLLLKLGGVAGLLVLASLNKLVLVPRLGRMATVHYLQISIRVELVLAIFVLAVTAWLTTAIGPAR
jgi:copper resistance protein D